MIYGEDWIQRWSNKSLDGKRSRNQKGQKNQKKKKTGNKGKKQKKIRKRKKRGDGFAPEGYVRKKQKPLKIGNRKTEPLSFLSVGPFKRKEREKINPKERKKKKEKKTDDSYHEKDDKVRKENRW